MSRCLCPPGCLRLLAVFGPRRSVVPKPFSAFSSLLPLALLDDVRVDEDAEEEKPGEQQDGEGEDHQGHLRSTYGFTRAATPAARLARRVVCQA